SFQLLIDSSVGSGPAISFHITAGQPYYVSIFAAARGSDPRFPLGIDPQRPTNGPGNYQLSFIYAAENDTPDTAQIIALGATGAGRAFGAFQESGDINAFRFRALRTGELVINWGQQDTNGNYLTGAPLFAGDHVTPLVATLTVLKTLPDGSRSVIRNFIS